MSVFSNRIEVQKVTWSTTAGTCTFVEWKVLESSVARLGYLLQFFKTCGNNYFAKSPIF